MPLTVWVQWFKMSSLQSDFNPGVLDGKNVCTERIITTYIFGNGEYYFLGCYAV